ncbi:zinc finger AN1 domain-containing stress-associated protein 12 [Neltuma alba]|uniref:zinc finger AN1 domain-containing stress-associated protein 12 n=1 Tax=Neltuma alba TaxID=207710 RepID=UPI0010A4F030|nr:zinc finger AN1 domain-containing stress-associated protein 12-like [Prosopis alba]
MAGGTEAFPDLGRHCQHDDCNLLDFLPFTCDGCHQVFCLEHQSYKSHNCPKADHIGRKVVVCEVCSMSIETTGHVGEDEKAILERHEKLGDCDPKKKKKPTCPVKRCKEILTFSSTSTCKTCHVKVCLKHRFPADHACNRAASPSTSAVNPVNERWNDRFLTALSLRNGKDCAKSPSSPRPPATQSVEAC